MLPSQGNLADEQRGTARINGNVGVGLYPEAWISEGRDGELPAPDSAEPAQRSEPTKAAIAGKSNEIKEMFHYPSSGVSVFNT